LCGRGGWDSIVRLREGRATLKDRGMTTARLDEDKLKQIVIATWPQGGLDRPVKVMPRGPGCA
jgi:hypothetical protein